MKILILTNNDIGLYKFRRELLQMLIDDGHTVNLSLPKGDYISEFLQMGCHFSETAIERRGMNPIREIELFFRYLIIFKTFRPDIILTYTIKPNIYGGIISKCYKKNFIVNITGLGSSLMNNKIKSFFIRQLYKIGISGAKCIFYQNASNLNFFSKHRIIGKKNILIPGSGVNLNEHKFETYPESKLPIVILFVGRIMREKGVNELFQSITEIKKKYSNVIFKIAGDYEDGFEELVQKLQKENIIEYLGFQKNVHELLKVSFALVLPSYHEGLSNVLLEAAACGRPVLASDIPGCRETFEEGKTGMKFKAKSVEDLKRVLVNFIDLPYEQKKIMGIQGRKKMEREFDRNLVLKAYMNEINR